MQAQCEATGALVSWKPGWSCRRGLESCGIENTIVPAPFALREEMDTCLASARFLKVDPIAYRNRNFFRMQAVYVWRLQHLYCGA